MTKFCEPVQQVFAAKTCVCAYKGIDFHFQLELRENSPRDDNLFLPNPFNWLVPLCVSVWVLQGWGTAE